MRRGLGIGAVLLAGLLASCGPSSRPTNVVVITLDTTRADRLGAYGYAGAQTPVLDTLADEGFVFLRHLTPVPTTLPSHTTLMSGLTPPEHTVRDNGTFVVPDEVTTLAEILGDAGFDTSAFIGAFPLDSSSGIDQGFGHYDDTLNPREESEFLPGVSLYFDERTAEDVVDSAIDYHRERGGERFFTFLHFFDPHQPLEPPAPYDIQFRHQPYDGEIAYVDEQLGRFFDFLRDRGDWDDTLVIVTADHGEGLGEHGELTHSMLLHQATLHIPMIVRGPGVPRGSTTLWTHSTQVFATTLELLGLSVPDPSAGVGSSLVPLLHAEGERPQDWPRFEAYFETIAPRAGHGWSQLTAWMREDWRLVHGPRPDLYNLEADPEELANRFADEPKIARDLFDDLASFLERSETSSVGESFQVADEETLRQLEALGYLNMNAAGMSDLDDMLRVEGLVDPKDRVFDIGLLSEAKAASMRGEWNRALSFYNELLRRSPDSWMGHQGLAILYGQIEDWETSFHHLDLAIELSEGLQSMKLFKGELLVQKGDGEAGLELLLSLDQEAPSIEQSVWTGRAFSLLGEHSQAASWYRRALATEPSQRWARLYLANALADSREDLSEAELLYQGLIAEFPYFHFAYYNYGKLLLDLGQVGAARGLLERSASLAPNHGRTREALAWIAEKEAADEG